MFSRYLLTLLCGLLLSCPLYADTPNVLTTVKPLQLIAAAVLDDIAKPELLLPPTVSPHHYALRPSDRRKLAQAERVYWVGPDMERFLQHLLEHQDNARRLDQAPDLTLRYFDSSHQQAAAEHEHAPNTLDGHLWLSIANARHIAHWMATDLSALYPQYKQQLQDNAETFDQRLQQLDSQLQARLQALAGKPYFVFHDGYGYFEDSMAIHHQDVFTLSTDIQPGARHLQVLRDKLAAAGPSCIFREPQFPTERIAALSHDLPVQIAVLDPLGIDIPADRNGYILLLQGLGNSLAECLEQL